MDDLLTQIETFCADHGLSVWDFGEQALNDRPFVGQLRNGRRVWPETADKARKWMASYRADRAA